MSFNDGFSTKGIATPPVAPTSGNVLVYDGTNWVAGTVSGGGGGTGDITSVTAGTNLTGGGTSGDITIALKEDIDVVNVTASNAFIQGNVRINGTASVAQLNTLNQTSLVVGDKYITILSGGVDHASLDRSGILWGSGSSDPTTNELGANAHIRFDGINDKLEIFPGLIVSGGLTASSGLLGTTANFNSVTASFKGNLDGTAATASYIATGSAIATFVSDVRQQISGSQYVSYSTGSGVVSLPFTGSTLGTTPLILGQTTTVLQGLTQLTASNISASVVSANAFTSSNVNLGGITQLGILVQTPSPAQILTATSTINVVAGIVKIAANSAISLTSTPTIQTAGIAEGTRILVTNVGANNITLQRDNVFGGGGVAGSKLRLDQANQTLTPYGTMEVIYVSGSTQGFIWSQIAKA